MFGAVTVGRTAWRGKRMSSVHPADAVLSLPAGLHSHGLRRLAVTEAIRGSFDQAKAAIDRRCGTVLGKRDLMPYGRQRGWEDSPPGWPQSPTYG